MIGFGRVKRVYLMASGVNHTRMNWSTFVNHTREQSQSQETIMDARNFLSAWIVGGGVGLIGLISLVIV